MSAYLCCCVTQSFSNFDSVNSKYISRDHLPCFFKNIYSDRFVCVFMGGVFVYKYLLGGLKEGWNEGHLPIRSITQRWSLHRDGCIATRHPWSLPSPGNETCDRNQPATSAPPPSLHVSVPLLSLLLLLPSFTIYCLSATPLTHTQCVWVDCTSTGGYSYILRPKTN